jgi:hypothetical protein
MMGASILGAIFGTVCAVAVVGLIIIVSEFYE